MHDLADYAAFALRVIVAGLAVALARRRSEHKSVAVFLALIAALDIFHFYVIRPAYFPHPPPYVGIPRIAFHIGQAISFAWPAGVAMLGWRVFLSRRPWPPVVAYAMVLAFVVIGYPAIRRTPLAYVHTIAYLASILAVLGCAAIWMRRKAPPRPEHAATLLLPLLELSLLAGPYYPVLPDPFKSWSIAQVTYAVLWSVLALLHIGVLWRGFLLPSPAQSTSSELH
jgi:hypothetical protein